MGLKALLVVVAAFGTAGLASVAGNFADSAGFSGRNGVTCVSCHTQPSPTNDDAKAVLDGLPASWSPGQTYNLSVSVTGGPPAMPAPQAQGGFDIAVDGGSLGADHAILRNPTPQEVTYLPAGTQQRAWTVQWQAPDLRTQPKMVRVWLAVLAANGNHVIALNASDGGETLDSADALQASIAPSPEALAQWAALPLAEPTVTATATADGWQIDGTQNDGNATGLSVTLDGATTTRDAGPAWRILVPAGAHTLVVHSVGAERRSPDVALHLGASTTLAPATKTAAFPVPFAALALALILRRRTP